MRELCLFVGCLMLAVGLCSWNQGRLLSEQGSRDAVLIGLGAPEGLADSPARSRLLGDYRSGLQANPSPQEYARLAELFLSTQGLEGKEVRASAHSPELMARILGGELEFFGPQGASWMFELKTLDTPIPTLSLESLSTSESVLLSADGPWILGQHGKLYGLFRAERDVVRGFYSSKRLTVDGDTILVDGKASWVWRSGELEAQP